MSDKRKAPVKKAPAKKKKRTLIQREPDSDSDVEVLRAESIDTESSPEDEMPMPLLSRAPKPVWPERSPMTLPLLAEYTGVKSVTCVDPGTRNCAVMRMQFHPKLEITHASVLDLHELCAQLELAYPLLRLRTDAGPVDRSSLAASLRSKPNYTVETLLFALGEYVRASCADGGAFHSDMLLVEAQSFDRLMAKVEATIVATYCSERLTKVVDILPGVEGGSIARAQTVSANSIKAYYAPFFPLVEKAPRKRSFGIGDANRGSDSAQRTQNKKMAVRYGSLILPQHRIAEVVERMGIRDQERLSKSKMDDLYDVLLMCGYFGATYLFQLAHIKRRGTTRPLPIHETMPQRKTTTYGELREFVESFTEPAEVALVLDQLAAVLFAEK